MTDAEREKTVEPKSEDGDGTQPSVRPDLTSLEIRQGAHRGDTYVRVVRPEATLRRVAPGVLRADEQASFPQTGLGALLARISALVFGKPLPSEAEKEERLSKVKALAVFASDALSSSAYASEEILIVLILAGTAGLAYALPISFAIAVLLGIVAFSYRQTVHAYPTGGGSYTVTKENLGTQPGLVAAAALLIGYVLTAAVSIAAGTAAITSAVPELYDYRVELSVGFVVLITMINLRGARESGTIFAIPTYLFIFSLATVIVVGVAREFLNLPRAAGTVEVQAVGAVELITLALLARAFAAGSVAMTGTEAISNGVPAFKSPESKNAATTLVWMAILLGTFFIGVSLLASMYAIVPHETETVISQIGRAVLGEGLFYFIFQIATMLILVLAANTSFAGFPRLASVLAQDGFMPNQFNFRGDRLAFSNGILYLGVFTVALLVLFQASTHALIPLYAIGVFIAFTSSQSGMVVHWWRTRSDGWRQSIAINGAGAILTAFVTMVIGYAKFEKGAWMVLAFLPLVVIAFNLISRHYRQVAQELALMDSDRQAAQPFRQIVLVPISTINRASLRALAFARTISKNPIALHIMFDPKESAEFQQEWTQWANGTDLVVLESPYRSLLQPFLAYVDALQMRDPNSFITIILAESLPAHWWQHLLHNQTALRLKAALLFRRNTVVIDVPYHLTS